MSFLLFLFVYIGVLTGIFIFESSQAMAHPDEAFDKTHKRRRIPGKIATSTKVTPQTQHAA